MSAGTQSLATAEKRAQPRPGGCARIFFQLFDGNRWLARKKLFSRKLLPPVRAAKWVSKKLGGHDKMPKSKLLLIAEENRGGFPKAEEPAAAAGSLCPSQEGNGMRSPGLMARLMGLESVPVVHEKPRKALDSESSCVRDESLKCPRLDQDLCPEFGGHGRNELRPQKLQKTEGFLVERQPVSGARFSSEVLSRSLLSRSKKQQHKFVSPVKSPRTLPRRSSARLMGVVTKILEPGLQSRNRAKCAITYAEESQPTISLKEPKVPLKDVVVGSCKSCGSLVEVRKLRLGTEEHLVNNNPSAILDVTDASSPRNGYEESKMKLPVMAKVHDKAVSPAIQAKINVQCKPNDSVERKYDVQNDQDKSKARQNVASNFAVKLNNLKESQLPMVKNRVAPGSKMRGQRQSRRELSEFHKVRDLVNLNKKSNNSTRRRSPVTSLESHTLETERNGCRKNVVRKRRLINSSQMENVVVVNSSMVKAKSGINTSSYQKGRACAGNGPVSGNSMNAERRKKMVGDFAKSGRKNDIVSVTFSSPWRQKSRSLVNEVKQEKARCKPELTHGASTAKKLLLDANTGGLTSQQGLTLTGHALSSLLDQKIRELTSLDQDESATGDASQRSTASILEVLMSALTMGAPPSQTNVDRCSDRFSSPNNLSDASGSSVLHNQMHKIKKKVHEETKVEQSAAFPACGTDHPSPMSILESSFSNDSLFSETINVRSGCEPHSGLTESSCNHQMDVENDLLDSATSLNIPKSNVDRDLHLINKNSSKQNFRFYEVSGCKFNDIGAISNAGLLFENIALDESYETMESSAELFLLDALETIIESLFTGSKNSLGPTVAKEGNQLKRLLFDCLIECLNSKCSLLCEYGYKSWLNLTFFLKKSLLTREVHEEVRGWRDLAGIDLDELIEKELCHSTSKWKEHETEVFEIGMEIESNILQVLINEAVKDLCQC